MKTLELKDICGYLPYGLMQKHYNDVCSFTIATQSCMGKDVFHEMPIRFGKPILRPMSDLTKGIIHRGKKFVPVAALNDIGRFIEFDATGMLYTTASCIDSDWPMVFDKFHEWMFDYRGLISAGLAIDVNTLPKNPYEK